MFRNLLSLMNFTPKRSERSSYDAFLKSSYRFAR